MLIKDIFLLLVIAVSAPASYADTHRDGSSGGGDIHSKDLQEIEILRKDIYEMRGQLNRIEGLLIQLNGKRLTGVSDEMADRWTCYMNDINVGHLYATGMSENEAKGKLLQRCSEKRGACFESTVRCGKADISD